MIFSKLTAPPNCFGFVCEKCFTWDLKYSDGKEIKTFMHQCCVICWHFVYGEALTGAVAGFPKSPNWGDGAFGDPSMRDFVHFCATQTKHAGKTFGKTCD